MAPVLPNPEKESLKNIEPTFDGEGKVRTAKRKSGLTAKIFSVFAAIVLWLYVFQAVEEDLVFKEIPITIENFNTGLELDIVSGYENALDVTVSGTKSVINELTSADIKASVDMSGVTERGTYVLDVSVEAPSSVKIVDKSVTQIRISLDKTIEKTIDLVPELSYNIQYPYELGETSLSEETVTLKGPETDINAVSKAAVSLALGNVKNNILSSAPVTLYDVNGYEIGSKFIVISPSTVELSIPVYKTSLFTVVPDIVINGDRFEYTVSPSSLYLKGAVNDVEALTALKTARAWIDSAGEYELSLMLADRVDAFTEYNTTQANKITSVKLTVTEKSVPVPLPLDGENTQNGEEYGR